MKAILIARVSTEEQKEAGNSLPAQIARLERYCDNKQFVILKMFSYDESAYSDDRIEFDRIIDFILVQKEKIVVCCDKVDRLSRNIFDKRISVLYEKALNDEIELHFISDGQIINSRISAVEKFQFGINLGLAKYYSDAISDNVKRAIEQKISRGEWPGKAPYGYQNIELENGNVDIVVDKYAACIVQKAFELYATGTYSIELVCKKLKEEHGIDWRVNYLHKIFNNPFYHGQMRIKKKHYKHRYPALITLELFEQVHRIQKGYSNKRRFKHAGQPYIYRGLLRCATCNLAITPEKHKGYVYYHCTQYNGRHDAKWLREEAITEQFAQVFKKLQMPPEVLHEIVTTLNQLNADKAAFREQELKKLTREQKELSLVLDNLYVDKLKVRITEEEYTKFYQSFRQQLTDVNTRLERIQEADSSYYITAKYLLELANRAYDLFMSSEVEEKRLLIKLVLQNLKLDGEKVVWEAQKPFDAMINYSESLLWRSLIDAFRKGEIEITVRLNAVQLVCERIKLVIK